ncbi:MAG: hypothetical protein K0R25_549 [Rickettsiaceae bacterium]|jgi:hypothetical protein|nr:hypothetical protein [Rickettsiaceae bacterium]
MKNLVKLFSVIALLAVTSCHVMEKNKGADKEKDKTVHCGKKGKCKGKKAKAQTN